MKLSTTIVCVMIGVALAEAVRLPAIAHPATAAR
jgi:hypothetical protein